MNPANATDARRRGSALIEFALAGSFIFLPLLAGMSTVGFQMVTALQVSNLTRDAGHMMAAGVDFSQVANQTMLQTVAGSLNLTGGNCEVILTAITDNNNVTTTTQTVIGASLGNSKFSGSPVTLQSGQSIFLAETYYQTTGFIWSIPGTGSPIYSQAIF